jgi:signal transduction histidine kinase/DNA-binding response OmpR family regulator
MQGRVLLVENDPTVSRIASDFLRHDGHTVVLAQDGEEGLQAFSSAFSSEEFDVVVTDVKMPKMDGLQLMKAIKRLDPSVEVIVLTGYGTFEMTIEVIRSGGYDFLRKPDDVAQRIRPTVRRAIEKRRLALKNAELLRALEAANEILEARILEKTQETRRLAAQHEVTRILAEASSLSETAPRVVSTLLDTLGWGFGAIWQIDRHALLLRCVEGRHAPLPGMERFAAQRRAMSLKSGEGLPGRVWATRQCVIDLEGAYYAADLSSFRMSGIGFPIHAGEMTLGVIEFCDPHLNPLDDNLMQMMGAVAIQLGQFFERERLEQQVLQSQKMEAIGRLAGGIAHDFNNLLTSIVGYAHLIEKRLTADDPSHRNVVQIQKTGQRAAALIQQLLAFSRRQILKPEILILNDVFSNLDAMLGRLFPDNIKVEFALDPAIEPVFADQTQLEQVIVNLAVNARDAMPSGGVLRFETANVSIEEYQARIIGVTPGTYVRLTVNDTGHGMDEGVQRHLFEPFFTTKEKGKGTGLGLATVYGIIMQSGGQIQVKSAPNEGATFNIYLPVSRDYETDSPDAGHIPAVEETEHNGSETVLLVEDEEDLRDIMREIIAQAGYTVLEASNGADALATFQRYGDTVHLVVTDIVMPVMNGDELIERVIRNHPRTRVVFMTGYADDMLIQRNVYETGIPILEKPFTPNQLLHIIREELDAPQPSHLRPR